MGVGYRSVDVLVRFPGQTEAETVRFDEGSCIQDQLAGICTSHGVEFDSEENCHLLVGPAKPASCQIATTVAPSSTSSHDTGAFDQVVFGDARALRVLPPSATCGIVRGSDVVLAQIGRVEDEVERFRTSPDENGLADALAVLLRSLRGSSWFALELIDQDGIRVLIEALVLAAPPMHADDADPGLLPSERAAACLGELLKYESGVRCWEDAEADYGISVIDSYHALLRSLLAGGAAAAAAEASPPDAPLCVLLFLLSLLPADAASGIHEAAQANGDNSAFALYTAMIDAYLQGERVADSVATLLCALLDAADEVPGLADRVEAALESAAVDCSEEGATEAIEELMQYDRPLHFLAERLQDAATQATYAMLETDAAILVANGGGDDGKMASSSSPSRLTHLEVRLKRVQEELRRTHKAMCKMASLVEIPEHPVLKQSIEAIAKYGFDSVPWARGYTALHFAADCINDFDVIEMLCHLANDKDLEAKDEEGLTPADYARSAQRPDVVQLLEDIQRSRNDATDSKAAKRRPHFADAEPAGPIELSRTPAGEQKTEAKPGPRPSTSSEELSADQLRVEEELRNIAEDLRGELFKYPTSGVGFFTRAQKRYFALVQVGDNVSLNRSVSTDSGFFLQSSGGRRFVLAYWETQEDFERGATPKGGIETRDIKHIYPGGSDGKGGESGFGIQFKEGSIEKEMMVVAKDVRGFPSASEAQRWVEGLKNFLSVQGASTETVPGSAAAQALQKAAERKRADRTVDTRADKPMERRQMMTPRISKIDMSQVQQANADRRRNERLPSTTLATPKKAAAKSFIGSGKTSGMLTTPRDGGRSRIGSGDGFRAGKAQVRAGPGHHVRHKRRATSAGGRAALEGAKSVAFTMKIENLVFADLLQDEALLADFKEAVTSAILTEAGNGMTPENVHTTLSEGAVVLIRIFPPVWVSASMVQTKLLGAASFMALRVLTKVKAVDGIAAVTKGTIRVSNVSTPMVEVQAAPTDMGGSLGSATSFAMDDAPSGETTRFRINSGTNYVEIADDIEDTGQPMSKRRYTSESLYNSMEWSQFGGPDQEDGEPAMFRIATGTNYVALAENTSDDDEGVTMDKTYTLDAMYGDGLEWTQPQPATARDSSADHKDGDSDGVSEDEAFAPASQGKKKPAVVPSLRALSSRAGGNSAVVPRPSRLSPRGLSPRVSPRAQGPRATIAGPPSSTRPRASTLTVPTQSRSRKTVQPGREIAMAVAKALSKGSGGEAMTGEPSIASSLPVSPVATPMMGTRELARSNSAQSISSPVGAASSSSGLALLDLKSAAASSSRIQGGPTANGAASRGARPGGDQGARHAPRRQDGAPNAATRRGSTSPKKEGLKVGFDIPGRAKDGRRLSDASSGGASVQDERLEGGSEVTNSSKLRQDVRRLEGENLLLMEKTRQLHEKLHDVQGDKPEEAAASVEEKMKRRKSFAAGEDCPKEESEQGVSSGRRRSWSLFSVGAEARARRRFMTDDAGHDRDLGDDAPTTRMRASTDGIGEAPEPLLPDELPRLIELMRMFGKKRLLEKLQEPPLMGGLSLTSTQAEQALKQVEDSAGKGAPVNGNATAQPPPSEQSQVQAAADPEAASSAPPATTGPAKGHEKSAGKGKKGSKAGAQEGKGAEQPTPESTPAADAPVASKGKGPKGPEKGGKGPPPPGGKGPPPPGGKGPPPPGGKGPPPPGGKGPPPPGGKGPGPPAKGAKGDGGKGAKGKGAAVESGPNEKPRKPMKPLWWAKLMFGKQLKEGITVWEKVKDLKVDLPLDSLEARLGKLEAAAKDAAGAKPKKKAKKEAQKLLRIITDSNLIVGKEAALRELPSAETVARALADLDPTVLNSHRLGIVREHACPNPAQVSQLEDLRRENPRVPFAAPEEYMWHISRVPAYLPRLDCWSFICTYEERASAYVAALSDFSEMIHAVFGSSAVPRLMGLILALGNYLNGGTIRGGAHGFDLETLGKLDTVKDNQEQSRDMRHMVFDLFLLGGPPPAQQDEEQVTEVRKVTSTATDLIKELHPILHSVHRTVVRDSDGTVRVSKSVRVVLEDIEECVKALVKEFAARQETLQACLQNSTDPADPLKLYMAEQFTFAKHELDRLEEQSSKCRTDFLRLLEYFVHNGMKSSDMILLWDNLLVPADLIINKPEAVRKKDIVPRFCRPNSSPSVEDLLLLWGLGGEMEPLPQQMKKKKKEKKAVHIDPAAEKQKGEEWDPSADSVTKDSGAAKAESSQHRRSCFRRSATVNFGRSRATMGRQRSERRKSRCASFDGIIEEDGEGDSMEATSSMVGQRKKVTIDAPRRRASRIATEAAAALASRRASVARIASQG